MGVINVTPDSFSDAGVHLRVEAAVTAAWGMLDAGAAIVDVGGESTRPGSEGVSAEEELHRIEPVIADLNGAPVSVDTSKAEVARRALELAELGRPLLIGFSRKSSLGKLTGRATGTTAASVGAAVSAYDRGATIIRAHDVREHVEALVAARAVGGT